MGEIRNHHCVPEMKEQSEQQKHTNSPSLRKVISVTTVSKIMASVFWDSKRIIMIDYLPRAKL